MDEPMEYSPREGSGSLMERAGIYTDVVPAPSRWGTRDERITFLQSRGILPMSGTP